jgi:hypothetical protein
MKSGNHNGFLLYKNDYQDALKGKWPTKNTAFLITHGIGNQKPIETLDSFSRGIIKALQTYKPDEFNKIELEHIIVSKKGDETYYWFDNFIRIKKSDSDFHIDIYEYYWANLTENKTNLQGIINWLGKVVSGAKKHYKDNESMVKHSDDKSIFIDQNGKLNYIRYFIILRILGSLGIGFNLLMKNVTQFIRYIPVFGNMIAAAMEIFKLDFLEELSNVIGDVVVYNDPNPRSDNQTIRKEILNDCVKAIQYLVTPETTDGNNDPIYKYGKVIIAGHSLGSEISFDAINRLTHQINLNQLHGYDTNGNQLFGNKTNISKVLDTFITFGSPLDKTAFFFREQSEQSEYIKRQILEDLHCFKQNHWDNPEGVPKIKNSLIRVFENITWINYYDNHDYVSGSLDYYHGLTNINCHFPNPGFPKIITHSDYWKSNEFFGDVLNNTL